MLLQRFHHIALSLSVCHAYPTHKGRAQYCLQGDGPSVLQTEEQAEVNFAVKTVRKLNVA